MVKPISQLPPEEKAAAACVGQDLIRNGAAHQSLETSQSIAIDAREKETQLSVWDGRLC